MTWQFTLRDNASRKSLSTVRMEIWTTPVVEELKNAIGLERAFTQARDKLSGTQPDGRTIGLLPPEVGRMMSEHLASSISPTDRANLLASLSRPGQIKGQTILTNLEWRIAGEACSTGSAAKDIDKPLLIFTAEVKTYRLAPLHDSLFTPPKEYKITK